MHSFVSVVATQKPIMGTLFSLSPRSWGRNITALSSLCHPRPWTQTTCHHPITLPPILVCCLKSMGFHSGELRMLLESRAMRRSPFPGARHQPSGTGMITEGDFCHALQSGVDKTREIRSPSWYIISDLKETNKGALAL